MTVLLSENQILKLCRNESVTLRSSFSAVKVLKILIFGVTYRLIAQSNAYHRWYAPSDEAFQCEPPVVRASVNVLMWAILISTNQKSSWNTNQLFILKFKSSMPLIISQKHAVFPISPVVKYSQFVKII